MHAKNLRGLGLRKSKVINRAFQCKLACKILTRTPGLWVQSMIAKYLHELDFLNCNNRHTDSSVWKSILKSRELLKKGIVWKVGKDDHSSFWFDN